MDRLLISYQIINLTIGRNANWKLLYRLEIFRILFNYYYDYNLNVNIILITTKDLLILLYYFASVVIFFEMQNYNFTLLKSHPFSLIQLASKLPILFLILISNLVLNFNLLILKMV